MFPLSRNFLKFAAASALVALTAVSTPALADELIQNLGPVGPHEPIITSWQQARHSLLRSRQWSLQCQAVVWKSDRHGMTTAAGFRVSLDPGQNASIDSADNKSLTLKCGDYAEILSAVDTDHQVASK